MKEKKEMGVLQNNLRVQRVHSAERRQGGI